MKYGYARVSTKGQNLDRQLAEFEKLELDKIYSEKQSGRNFNTRQVYQTMKKHLKGGDILYIVSIDRLGRNYEQILEEWRFLTEKKRVDIVVLDMPVLNTQNSVEGLDGRFISNLVLQIIAYVSQKEREKIQERQRMGIDIAKEKGVKFGRPKIELPENTNDIIQQYSNKEISVNEALLKLGVSRGTFYRLLKPEEKLIKHYQYTIYCKDGKIIQAKNLKEVSKKTGYSSCTIREYINGRPNCVGMFIDKIEEHEVEDERI